MDCISALYVRPALLLAFLVNPLLLVRLAAPRADAVPTAAVSGALAIALNTLVALLLRLCGCAFDATNLALLQWLVFAALTIGVALRPCALKCPPLPAVRLPLLLAAAFALLVFPLTPLAGIDTYKWQDLAGIIAVDRSLSWVVHPLSVLGFTPRAYPCAQPVLLATAQVLGGLGVDAGYYLVSLACGFTGISAAAFLAIRLFGSPSVAAAWFPFLYVFSPVFLRYTHWATGRGLFLALFPLFLACLLDLRSLRKAAAALGLAVLLALSHKTALVAIPVVILSLAFAPLLPRRGARVWSPLLAAAAMAAALPLSTVFLAPSWPGRALGFARTDVTRFGCLLAPALVGLSTARIPALDARPALRRFFPAFLAALPLAHFKDMYGALVFLPFAALLAAQGIEFCAQRLAPFYAVRRRAALAAILLTLVGPLAVVAHRTLNATSRDVAAVAAFLNRHDPAGPFRIEAPEPARAQIQAYVAGCPRPVIRAAPTAGVRMNPPPPLRGSTRQKAISLTHWLRNCLRVEGVEIDWYGGNPRRYYVTVDGEGVRPAHANVLVRSGSVVLMESAPHP